MSANNLAKSAKEKDQSDNDLCKKHASRCDKDNTRTVCPSKLSKRELEDLYYSLLDNNLELKRTINALNEKNRIMSTKVQRMMAQTKTYIAKDCCAAGKAVINEQKATLADMTRANEALADRVRRLSTQLCTAKQFLKQNPNARTCYKCFANATTSAKNLSTTSLQNKSSNVNLKSAAASAIHLDQEPPSTRTAETNTIDNDEEREEKGSNDKVCSENRCRTTMEQLKQKICDLEEELVNAHAEYSTRMTQLESQVSELRAAAMRARSELSVRARARDSLELARLRQADVDKADLETQLTIEKKKVAELEMRLKAAMLSQEVAQTVEDHLSTARRLEEKQLRQTSAERCSLCSNMITGDVSAQAILTSTPNKTPNQLIVPDDKVSKSDDSGYADHRQETDSDDKILNQNNEELTKRIEEMQAQLDALKLITAGKDSAELEASPCPEKKQNYYARSDSNQEIKNDDQILPKHTQISICEPTDRPSKKPVNETCAKEAMGIIERRKSRICDKITQEIEIPSKDEDYGINYSDLSVSNLRGENVSAKEQAAEINTTVRCECPNDEIEDLENNRASCKNDECKQHSKICSNGKEDSLNARSSKETDDRVEINSVNLDQAVGNINTKPNSDELDNVSETSTPTKRKRVSLVIFENGAADNRVSLEMDPKSAPDGILKDTTPDPIKPKAHDCNFQQIPGPLPVSNESTGKRRVSLKEKKTEYRGNNANTDDRNTIDKDIVMTKVRYFDKDIKKDQDKNNNVGKNIDMNYGNDLKKIEDKDVYNSRKNKGLVIEVQYPERYKNDNQDNDPLIPVRSKEKLSGIDGPVSGRQNVMADYKGARDILKSIDYETERFQNGNSEKINGITNIKEFDICQHHATICTCPEKPSPSLTLFRSCTGSQTLVTLPVGGRFRWCSCSEKAARYSWGPILKDKPVGSSTPRGDRAPTASPHTYTVDSGKSRAESPANTDNEISVMTDLPSEKDDTYDALSPGEQKVIRESLDTCSLREGLTISEGEVPGQERRTSKSVGEVRRADQEKEPTSYGVQKSSAEKMEATLLAISQELARCRYLLQSQRPTEQKDVASGSDHCGSVPLRKTIAKSRIEGTVAPTCLFIMHVVSVVFSDEAILRSRDIHLMLTWQFADCKPIVIPLDAERVVHFDYSTQHELQMTREVVEYLKKEDLSIMISEMDNVKNNIASCVLPLCQVLLNINNRIDLTLPLTAGPHLRDGTPDTFNAGDDVGVLDVWCMLLCEQRQLLATNQTIAQCTESPKNSYTADQRKENNSMDTESSQQKHKTRQTSFQRQKIIMLSNHGSHPENTTTSLEGRHQVGFEEPRDRYDKDISLLQCYKKDDKFRRNSATSYQQAMSPPSISKSQFSKVPDDQFLEITILWLTLNENCESILPKDWKLYVAYTFLGRVGAELETPSSLPLPKHYTDKCIFNFSKSFNLTEMDMRVLEHMVSCRSQNRSGHSSNDCIVFTVVSEPPEDPLGLNNCEDIGFAFLYLGDLLAYCSGDSFTEALPVLGARAPSRVCGVLAVRVDGLDVLRACRQRTT